MLTIKSLLIVVLSLLLLPSFSLADTFVVTNLNDPGAGSLRQAIINSNLNLGPDTIEFNETLQGTIFLNLGPMSIQDDLTIKGPGAEIITIDADNKSPVFEIDDFDEEINRVVKISGLRFINGDGGINNYAENVEVENCQFINCSAAVTGGAMLNRKILTVDSCLFENNSAPFGGGAISNDDQSSKLIIRNSEFRDNQSDPGSAILNLGTIQLVTNSKFSNNAPVQAIANIFGTIKEISHSTFERDRHIAGGAIWNSGGIIESILNSAFSDNSAPAGGTILNVDGIVNISFSTIAKNLLLPPPTPPPVQFQELMNIEMEGGSIVTLGLGITRIRNSIVAFNSTFNCEGPIDDFGGNYSNDFSCGFTGDDSVIILGPLADNGGPTETMALLGGDPVNGATVNCDALDENGNPTGIPIGVDQRYFPRPFGIRCDSGAVESMPASIVTITKASQPSGMEGFEFVSNGFGSLVGCGITADNGRFTLDDGDSERCIVPVGDYTIREKVPNGYRLSIICFGDNPNLIIDDDRGEILFSVPEIEPSPDVDCIFNNIKKGKGGGGCVLTGGSNNNSLPLFLLIPAFILFRRFIKRYRS